MAARSRRARFQSDSHTGTDGPPRKKMRAAEIKQQLDILAPRPILDGLPDNIMLCIMSLLDIRSLINLSRVCKRFHHLYSDEFIWNSVDLTRESVGFKLDPRKLKNIIRLNLPQSVRRVKLSSNAFSLSSKQPAVTESVFDLLFERCPNITSIAVHKCDLTILSQACKLYHAIKLTHLSFVECKSNHVWFKEISPSWPNLTHLSFEGTTMIGDDDLKYVATGPCGKSIRYLNLRGCYRISRDLLLKVCSDDLIKLKELDVRKCADEISKSVEFLKHDRLKHIKIIYLV